jgi:hypothetical protein
MVADSKTSDFKSSLFRGGFRPEGTSYLEDIRALLGLGEEGLKAYSAYLRAVRPGERYDDRPFLQERLGPTESAKIEAIQRAMAFHLRNLMEAPDDAEFEFSDLLSVGGVSSEQARLLTDFFSGLGSIITKLKDFARVNVYKERGARVFRGMSTACRMVVTFTTDYRVTYAGEYKYEPASDFDKLTPVALVSITSALHSREEIVDFQAEKWQLKDIIKSLSLAVEQLEMLEAKFGSVP